MADTTGVRSSFVIRLIGAMALDPVVYEEIEADRSATAQALVVVVLSSMSAGIGARAYTNGSVGAVLFISGLALVAWLAWAVVTFQIGARLMPEPQTRSDVGELLRTIGFSAAPGMLRIFGIVPGATIPAFAITAVWMLAAMIVAVRQSLDYTSTARAVAVCALGWTLALAIAITLGLVFGPTVQ
jgi:hypothetical protein